MSLTRRDKFAASQSPYALDPNTFDVSERGLSSVTAIWAGRKNGRTTASFGTLVGEHNKHASFEEFVAKVDMRYGGTYEGKWDGRTLITESALPELRRLELINLLDGVLSRFPLVPEGYEGWFYRA
ncbi:hypothetical protein FHT44_004983 [Mycolicibacterium sp. BK634]|uniref:hypothetical protein n=1 Tax=Mycolicibacterium sp. BK634 TaxID=2587099 RepID=UPI0016169381|nr:hypothetical protein [Mycolicibacterium sp. BK634]MBB3752471.1 hypothetical protein [Mycolicibacterium sp. BK634]